MGLPSVIDIMDKTVAIINDHVFAAPYNVPANVGAIRAYVPEYTAEDLQNLLITVVPEQKGDSDIQIEPMTRGEAKYTYPVEVGVQKRYANDAEADTLVRFSEEMADLFFFGNQQFAAALPGNLLPNKPSLTSKTTRPLFSFTKNVNHLIFMSVIRLEIRLTRET